jgi:hypothetical protein
MVTFGRALAVAKATERTGMGRARPEDVMNPGERLP